MARRRAALVAALGLIAVLASCGSTPAGGDAFTLQVFGNQPLTVTQRTAAVLRARLRQINDASTVAVVRPGVLRVGLDRPERRDVVLETLARPGQVTFRPVVQDLRPPCTTAPPSDGDSVLPEQGPNGQTLVCYQVTAPVLDGSIIASAEAITSPFPQSTWSIRISFTPSGSAAFDAVAGRYINHQLAIVIDGRVASAPTIQTAHFVGSAQITGSFTEDQARTLAAVLNAGPLPAPFVSVQCSGKACGSTVTLPAPTPTVPVQTVPPLPSTSTPPSTLGAPQTSVPRLDAPPNVGCPATNGSSPHYTHFSGPPPTCIRSGTSYTATFVTDVGTFTVALDAKAAPKTVNNFVFLAGYHFYDGIIFHRVIPGFVVQGGDPTGTGTGGPGYTFADELPGRGAYQIGSVAMANAGPDTNGSQFFIITGAQGVALPPNYSLFGQVASGLDVVKKIEADGTTDPGPPVVVHHLVRVTVST